jgi:hypothetical protein
MSVQGHGAAAADLLDILHDVAAWRLDRHRWQRVEQVISDVTAALAASDLSALRKATAELELAGPARVHRIAATAVVAAPPPIREGANRVIHSLHTTGVTAGPPGPR